MHIKNVNIIVLSTLAIFTASFLAMLCINSASKGPSSSQNSNNGSNTNAVNTVPTNNNLKVGPANNNNNPDNVPAHGNDNLNTVPAGDDAEEDNECAICYYPINQPHVLPCGHKFCRNCISEWARRSPHPTCPTCRREFTWND